MGRVQETLAEILDDDQFLAYVRNSLLPTVWDCAIPIIAQHEGSLRQHGTATLFRVADRQFLVSAAHVFTQAKKANAILRARTHGPKAKLVAIGGPLRLVHSLGDDIIDVGIMEIHDQKIAELSGYRAIGLVDIDQRQDTSDDLYIVAGFPCELARPGNMDGEPIGFGRFFASTYPYRGRADHLGGYNATHHLLLDARPAHCEIVAGEGGPLNSFRGVSGASIWKVNAVKVGRENWQPMHARISAVQTAQYLNPVVLRGTMWRQVAYAIHESFPELRPALSLTLPQV
ncbi:MAG: hypothetical protein AB7O59_03300 [Pirellulales bacterium]